MLQQFSPSLRLCNPVSTTTGARDSLAAINTSQLPDGALCPVIDSGTGDQRVLYILNKGSSLAQSLPSIVAPAEGGPGRWFLYSAGGSFFQTVAIGHAAIPPATGIDSAAVAVTGATSSNDVISYDLLQSDLNAGIAMGPPRITGSESAVWRLTNVTAATIAAGTISARVMVSKSP